MAEIITALSSIIVAGFTGTLWYVTWGLTTIARKQREADESARGIEAIRVERTLKIAEDHAAASQTAAAAARANAAAATATTKAMLNIAKRQLRAYVSADSVTISGVKPNHVPKVVISVKNYGQTPAIKFVIGAGMGFDTYPSSFSPSTSREGINADIGQLGPQQPANSHLTGVVLKQLDIDRIMSGKWAVYAVGVVEYEDIFGFFHKTTFRFYCRGPERVAHGAMSLDSWGNDMT